MKKRYITTTIALMLLTATVTYSTTLFSCQKRYNETLGDLNRRAEEYAKIAEVQGYIENNYVNEYEESQLLDGAVYGMVAFLGDKWSHYLPAKEFKAYLDSLSNNMVGIGVNVSQDNTTGGIMVIDVFSNSPAATAGIKPHDLVIKVDGEAVNKLGYDAAVNKVRGESGTTVKLTVYRPDEKKNLEVSIVRQAYHVENVKAQMVQNHIGYIKIREFALEVDKEFTRAVKNLKSQGAQAFVFDVRNNPGGALPVLVNCLDILLPKGVIITAKDKAGKVDEYRSDAKELTLPMAVLVNEHSISAAEFFAASLQEYGKATIVGTPTTGKGCAQNSIRLKDGSGLILSTSKYYTKNGVSLAETKGIKPDQNVPLTEDQMVNFYKMTLDQDPQMQAAIKTVQTKLAQK